MNEKLVDFIAKRTNIQIDQINDGMMFNEFGIDSVELMCLVADLETEFNIQVTDRELDNLFTVGDLKNLLNNKCK